MIAGYTSSSMRRGDISTIEHNIGRIQSKAGTSCLKSAGTVICTSFIAVQKELRNVN
jgi:hypothetical protein